MEMPPMAANTTTVPAKRIGPRELRRLLPAERDANLIAAAKDAEAEYRTNRDLTAFEAFRRHDLH
jgi:hypothetical protein